MLELRSIHKSFVAGHAVLCGVSLSAAAEEIVCLLGPSGCGKSTLLRIIAGLEQADRGQVLLRGGEVNSHPVHQRKIGLMFQDYALFPHLTVADNIAYGLRMQRMPAAQQRARVAELLALVELGGYEGRAVDGLSGGEQQRVALARTLAPNPALLLLDEPVANLDRQLREELTGMLRRVLKQVQATALLVTHDQEEAFVLADRVAVMRAGRIEQVDPPAALYQRPANTFVARFLGFQNLLPVRQDPLERDLLQTPAGQFRLCADSVAGQRLLIPPDAARLADEPPGPHAVRWVGRVVASTFRGSLVRVALLPAAGGEQPLWFELRSTGCVWAVGTELTLWLDPTRLQLVAES